MVSAVQPRERLLAAALAAHQAGRLDDAASLYRRTIAAHPGSDVAHHNLGLIDHAAGRLAEAEAGLGRAIKINPRSAVYLTNMASVLVALGKPQEALDAAKRALDLEPGLAAAHNTMGLALVDLDSLNEAEAAYQQALRLEPRYVEALMNLARLRLRQNRAPEAQKLAESAIRQKPQNAKAYVVLGDAFRVQKQAPSAAECYRRALSLGLDTSDINLKLGEALSEAGDADAARGFLDRAVTLAPDDTATQWTLGNFLQYHGELEAAAAIFRKLLAKQPVWAELRASLARTVTHRARDEAEILALEGAYADAEPRTNDRMHLAFGLGKVFEDLKEYALALDYVSEGNAIRRTSFDYSIDMERARFGQLATAFSADYITAHQGGGDPTRRPIFIVGMPRSGTTLTEQILASHPDVFGAGELEFMGPAARLVLGFGVPSEAYRLSEMTSPADFGRIARTYLAWLPKAAADRRFVTDKMPQNFLFAGLIRLVFPNAHIVHVRRSPLDNCLSIFKNYFAAEGLQFAYDLVELGHYYNLYRDLMRHWHAVMPGGIHDVQYEDLVSEPEATSRALLDYCGLDWRPEVLDFHLNKRQIKTASFAQVRRPIYKDSVNLSARYGDRLQPLIDTLAEWKD